MQVRLLGQVEAVDPSGQALVLGGPMQRRILAALALRRNEVVSVPYLVDLIWPDGEAPARAAHNVRTYIHRLRSAFDDEGTRLETVGAGYRLRLGDRELDAARFEQLAGTARRLAATGEVIGALDAIDAAEQLWRGLPIEEFRYEDWAVVDVTRLRELHIEVRTLRAEALTDAGRSPDAIAVLEGLIHDEPLRERPRALLMRALHTSGRHADALRAFQDFRRSLIEETGIEPSQELVELDRAIAVGQLATGGTTRRGVGGYELHERVGEGAFAVVHRATQTSLGRDVAVKIIRAELANRPEFIRRFEAEARTVARIEHPNVVPLYDYWREPDRAFLVMRWMAGGSLETRLDDGPWSLADTIELVDQIAGALSTAHERGVVHGDVKPENILFDDEGRAYLGDFAIALGTEQRARAEATRVRGSQAYASPEQLRCEPVGPEADVYALAIVACVLLTHRTPLADAAHGPTLAPRRLPDPIPTLRDHWSDLSSAVEDVLATATAERPASRYPTPGAFAAALRAANPVNAGATAQPRAGRPRANPYKGLRAFDETDAADFHGRERLVDELVGRLASPDSRMVAVVGPSGSGKSSVVRAGVIPALREGRVPGSSQWFITTMVPGSRPFEALETALLRVAVRPPAALLDQLCDGERGILRAVKRILPYDDGVVAIVIDQFEQLFTGGVAQSERDLLLSALAVCVTDPTSPVRLLLTMRADFYDRPLRHAEFAPLLKQETVVVTPLTRDELERAVVTPAASVGVALEPGLTAEIIADVSREPGALPLLQYALTQALEATDSNTITLDVYHSIGGLTGALTRRAEQLYQDTDTREQRATRHLFSRLVTLGEGTEDIRRRVRLSELPEGTETSASVDRFGRARLLTFDRDETTREPTVEVAHEALIREWPRLRGWLDEDRDGLRIHRHLTDTAKAWTASGRDDGELYRGARLDAAAAWAKDHGEDLNDSERMFLDASIAAAAAASTAEHERFAEQVRTNRRLRSLVAAVTLIALLAATAGVFALQQRSRADDEASAAIAEATAAEQARREADTARALADASAARALESAAEAGAERARAQQHALEAKELANEAVVQRDAADLARLRATALLLAGDSDLALLLAIEADRLAPSADTKDTLQRVLAAGPVSATMALAWGAEEPLMESLPLPMEQIELLESPTARLYVAVVEGGEALLTSVGTRDRTSTVVRHQRAGARWEATDLGIEALVTSAGEHTIWVSDEIEIRGPTGDRIGPPIARPVDLVSFHLSENGDTVVLQRSAGLLEVYAAGGGAIGVATLPETRPGDQFGISILADGSMISAWSQYDRATTWALWTTNPLTLEASGISGFDGSGTIETDLFQQPILDGSLMYAGAQGWASLRIVDPTTDRVVGELMPLDGTKLADVTTNDALDLVAVRSFEEVAGVVEGTVRVFDVASGQQLGSDLPVGRFGNLDDIQATAPRLDIQFDAAGRLIVQDRDSVAIWNYDTSTWRDLACRLVGHNMNREQWDLYGPTGARYRRTCEQYPIES